MTEKVYGHSERELAKAFVDAISSVSPRIDKFSTWLMGGTAAAMVLIYSNIESTGMRLGPSVTKLLLSVLAMSLLFGLAQKYVALQLQLHRDITDSMEKKVRELAAIHAGKDVPDPYEYWRKMPMLLTCWCLLSQRSQSSYGRRLLI